MTSNTDRISAERLAEMLAGLEKLPHAPWFCGPAEGKNGTAGLAQVDNGAEMWPVIGEWPEAEHIARCDPDTIRSLITELQALRASTASGEPVASLRKSGQEFLEAAEAVFDWMNGNDLSADHEEQKPDDFERVSKALVEFRAALSSDNPDTTQNGEG